MTACRDPGEGWVVAVGVQEKVGVWTAIDMRLAIASWSVGIDQVRCG
jgi:hypothetical protein